MTAVVNEDVAWHRVAHDSSVGVVRRAAVAIAERLGFGEARVGEVGIVTTEITTNQVRHAGGGTVLLRVCRAGEIAGIEIVAIDGGPGMADVPASLVDGHSTAGTLGIGLGAVARLATSWDVFSSPGRGTVLVASIGPDGVTSVGPSLAVGGITRPMNGEEVCGDAYAVRVDGDGVSVLLVDGLGHGPLAARASAVAVEAFRRAPAGGPLSLLTAVHRALPGTRGAAAAVLQDAGGAEVRYAGIGNISGHILGGPRRRGMMSYPGIAGAQTRTVREAGYEAPPGGLIVMHSDGVTDKLDLDAVPTLLHRTPTVIAALTLRDYGVRNDDASVAVLRRAAAR